MKKLFSILIIGVLLCGVLIAEGGPTDIVGGKTLNVILDLTTIDSMASAHAGVTLERPILSMINTDYSNSVGASLVISPTEVGTLTFNKTIYIWYYLCALEGQCEVIFMPGAFSNNSGDYLGYILTAQESPTVGSNFEGTSPLFNGHIIGPNPNYDASTTGKIITSNYAGISRGFIEYDLEVDCTLADPVEYSAPWTIQIRVI